MTMSETYKDQGTDASKLQSRTYYYGEKGDEIANYAWNYKMGTTTVKSTTKFFYGASFADAPGANPTDAMTMSETYKDQGTDASKLQSRTYYYGEKGDEIANYAWNYKFGTPTVLPTTKFFYAASFADAPGANPT